MFVIRKNARGYIFRNEINEIEIEIKKMFRTIVLFYLSKINYVRIYDVGINCSCSNFLLSLVVNARRLYARIKICVFIVGNLDSIYQSHLTIPCTGSQ